MNPILDTAANGHLILCFNEVSDACWLSIAENLIKLRGFKRSGSPVISLDEKIYQNFQCPEFNLAAGWDNWSGHYLRSDSVEVDVFLAKTIRPAKCLTGDSRYSLRCLRMRALAFGCGCGLIASYFRPKAVLGDGSNASLVNEFRYEITLVLALLAFQISRICCNYFHYSYQLSSQIRFETL